VPVGAYGEVRKCLHKETKALRAVKIINKKYLEEDEKDKLQSEISILKSMDHPNILKVYEVYEDDKCFYLVCEQVHGC
jgi:calcium-dependent protein kinase